MSSIHITLAHDWPAWLVALISTAAVLLVVLPYWTAGRRLRRRALAVLILLRVAAVALLVLLLFRPTLNFTRRKTERSQVILLVDESISMGLKDGRNVLSRLDWVKDALGRKEGVLATLRKDFDLSLFAFSSTLRALHDNELAELKPVGESTHLAQAVAAIADKADRERLAGVLALTDGIDNSGHDPTDRIVAYGLPVYTVGVGTRLDRDEDFRDLFVHDVRTPQYATVDNTAEIKVAVGGIGYPGREVTVEMKQDDAVVATAKAVIQAGDSPALATLKLTPKKAGQYDYVAAIAVDPEERVTENNRYTFSLIVTEPRIKVLYIEGALRPEHKFLKRTLESDPNVRLLSLVEVAKGTFVQYGQIDELTLRGVPDSPEVLAKFDVFILGDIDRSYFSDAQLARFEEGVRGGAGLLMLGGQRSLGPGGYGGTPMETLLPVRLGSRTIGQVNEPFQMELTREGRAHPIFEGTESFFVPAEATRGRALPTLRGCTRVGEPKAGAQILADRPAPGGAGGALLPVLVVQAYGKGRSMVFTADTTWQWYLQLRPLGAETPYVKFWGQAIRWLAGLDVKKKQAGAGLTLYTDRRLYQPSEPVKIRLLARDDLGQAANRATITVTVLPSGQGQTAPATLQLPHIAGSAGEYASEFAPPAPGPYRVRASGIQDDIPLGQPVETSFRVGKPNLEYQRLGMNESLLRRVADVTGGKYYPLVQVEQLARSLHRRQVERSVSKAYRLWSAPYFFLAFVAFVTAEWILRRRKQMP